MSSAVSCVLPQGNIVSIANSVFNICQFKDSTIHLWETIFNLKSLFLIHKMHTVTRIQTNHFFLFPSIKSIWISTYVFTICFAANVGLLYGVLCTVVIVIFRFPRWETIYWNILVAHRYVFFLAYCFTVRIGIWQWNSGF